MTVISGSFEPVLNYECLSLNLKDNLYLLTALNPVTLNDRIAQMQIAVSG